MIGQEAGLLRLRRLSIQAGQRNRTASGNPTGGPRGTNHVRSSSGRWHRYKSSTEDGSRVSPMVIARLRKPSAESRRRFYWQGLDWIGSSRPLPGNVERLAAPPRTRCNEAGFTMGKSRDMAIQSTSRRRSHAIAECSLSRLNQVARVSVRRRSVPIRSFRQHARRLGGCRAADCYDQAGRTMTQVPATGPCRVRSPNDQGPPGCVGGRFRGK